MQNVRGRCTGHLSLRHFRKLTTPTIRKDELKNGNSALRPDGCCECIKSELKQSVTSTLFNKRQVLCVAHDSKTRNTVAAIDDIDSASVVQTDLHRLARQRQRLHVAINVANNDDVTGRSTGSPIIAR